MIEEIESIKAVTTIFIFTLWDTNRKGLKNLKSLKS